ncbi:ATP-grasp domain-containing protein [Photobacterium sp. 53610]|uniref:ATP-grasp domain-containing protein n=1 Tax=Photobacterium sp. 53610 TaxID=3102789 RepID=UPI002ED9E92B
MSIVVIDPVSSGTAYIHAAAEMGIDLHILCIDEGERKLSHDLRSLVQSVIKVDSRDMNALVDAIEELGNVEAIFPGSEYTVPVCSQLAKYFGLPHLDEAVIDFVRDKYAFRTKLKETQLSHIHYFSIDKETELQPLELPDGFTFPAVIKPVDMSGSTEVRRVDNIDEFVAVVTRLSQSALNDLDFVSSGKFIIEEYIPGHEFSVEGVVIDNQVEIVSITEKVLGQEPYFVEFGHIVGHDICESIASTIRQYAEAVVNAIGVNIGPFHLELRVRPEGQPVAIEMAARMPGDKIVELIKQSYGVDLAQMTIAAYTNRNITRSDLPKVVSAISFIPRGNKEVFTELSSIEKYMSHKFFKKHEIYFNHGDVLGSHQDWTSRVGYFIFSGDDYHEIKSVVHEVNTEVGLL